MKNKTKVQAIQHIEIKVDSREIVVEGLQPSKTDIAIFALRKAMERAQFVHGVVRTHTGESRKPWKYIFTVAVTNPFDAQVR